MSIQNSLLPQPSDKFVALSISRSSRNNPTETLSALSRQESLPLLVAGDATDVTTKSSTTVGDSDTHCAVEFIATVRKAGVESQFGFGYYATSVKEDVRYLTLMIADDPLQTELAAELAMYAIQFARDQGIRELYSITTTDNPQMRKLASDLGMDVRTDPARSDQIIYSLTLS